MVLYHVIAAGAGIGLLEGSEIGMLMVAAASAYKWRNAWKIAFAGLATLVPLLAALYFFFTFLPVQIAGIAAGIIIFVLGAHFFIEGIGNMGKKDSEEGREKIGAGLVGVYSAIVLEEAEAGSITMSIAVAAGGAYFSAILGMMIGLLIPLIAVKKLEPLIEKVPEWAVQIAVGAVMMAAACAIIILRI